LVSILGANAVFVFEATVSSIGIPAPLPGWNSFTQLQAKEFPMTVSGPAPEAQI
jgi:hypothetical protein